MTDEDRKRAAEAAADGYVRSLITSYHHHHLAMRPKDSPSFGPDACANCIEWPKTLDARRQRRAFITGFMDAAILVKEPQ